LERVPARVLVSTSRSEKDSVMESVSALPWEFPATSKRQTYKQRPGSVNPAGVNNPRKINAPEIVSAKGIALANGITIAALQLS
jgi:hypothetical protein